LIDEASLGKVIFDVPLPVSDRTSAPVAVGGKLTPGASDGDSSGEEESAEEAETPAVEVAPVVIRSAVQPVTSTRAEIPTMIAVNLAAAVISVTLRVEDVRR
jgi:hypothetical protein